VLVVVVESKKSEGTVDDDDVWDDILISSFIVVGFTVIVCDCCHSYLSIDSSTLSTNSDVDFES